MYVVTPYCFPIIVQTVVLAVNSFLKALKSLVTLSIMMSNNFSTGNCNIFVGHDIVNNTR